MRPLPPALLRPALDAAMAAIRRRHPGLLDRLSGLGDPTFLIDPTDIPFRFLLLADAEEPRLRAVGADEEVEATATIRGPLMTLIDLMEGRLDGDALFFSRDLVVEGDTEAVVALRNAVESAEIDLVSDLLSMLGPLALPAGVLASGAGALLSRLARDMETVRAAIVAPAARHAEAQAVRLRELDEKVTALGARRARTNKGKTARS